MGEYIVYRHGHAGSTQKCAVCGYHAYAYLNNTDFCDTHFDLALRRTIIISGINARANAKDATPFDRWFREELFRKNPDAHHHAKYLKIADCIFNDSTGGKS